MTEQETIKKIQEAVGKKENYSLEDVLIALNKDRNNMFNVLVMPDGNFGYYNMGKFYDRRFGWKLNKPFHEQPKETLTFISNLLSNKEELKMMNRDLIIENKKDHLKQYIELWIKENCK